MRPSRSRPATALLLCVLSACAPPLNWRQTTPQGGGMTMLFPCRPDQQERTIHVAASDLRMRMYSCGAAGAVFSLAFVDVNEPARVAPVMAALRAAAQANLDGTAAARAWAPPGGTPNERSALVRIEGRLPDGRRVVEHVAFFVRGMRLYEATALGESLDADALDTFFDSIKIAT